MHILMETFTILACHNTFEYGVVFSVETSSNQIILYIGYSVLIA